MKPKGINLQPLGYNYFELLFSGPVGESLAPAMPKLACCIFSSRPEREKMIRQATTADAAAIVAIYNHYVVNTSVTFEEQAVSAEQMAERIEQVQNDGLPWLVLEQNGELLGYAYATKWRARSAYRFSVESTVYVKASITSQGIGSQLYQQLLAELKDLGLHLVIGGITLPNEKSVALHEKLGFEKCGHFQQAGFKFEQWRDVGYWQKLLQ
ncbi:sortase-like acyltransferase [Rheinheimera sp. A13L]|nr:sortase-like acyltransferase [Rheinheimera sp. A13L]